MGWSKRQFIEQAYGLIGYSSYAFDMEPEQFESARRLLDSMMASWNDKGVRLRYPLAVEADASSIEEDTGVPDRANEAIYTNLAVRLGPTIGKSASMDIKILANQLYKQLICSTTHIIPRKPAAGMPLGAGNKTARHGHTFTQEPINEAINVGDDGPLEI